SATVESLVIKASNAEGILGQGTHGLRLRKVTLQGCGVEGAAGIRMDDAQVSIEDSEISGSGTAGIRAVTSDLALSRSQVHGNAAAGLRTDRSSSPVSDRVFANTPRGVGLVHGSVSTLERNQLSGNADTGLYVYAGDDIQDQVRSTAKSSHNIVTGSEQGLQIFNSDLSSEDDRFDGNGDGVIAGYGASMSAVRLSASDNRRLGILTRDVVEYIFCADPDCTMTLFASALVHFKGDVLDVERNAGDGFQVLTGGDVEIRRSTMSGNGVGGYGNGISVFSGNDYQLGDGIVHHVDIPGRVRVSVTNLDHNNADGLVAV